MGRWAQRQLRGGGPGQARTPNLLQVKALGGNQVELTFDGNVGVTPNLAAPGFTINTIFTVAATPVQVTTKIITLTMSGTILAGYTFACPTSPSFLDRTIVVPITGSVTA
jgi:hypothetical protein